MVSLPLLSPLIFPLILPPISPLITLYTSRKSLQHLLTTGVPSCEEPWSAHEQTCKISREELPHPIKQRRDEQRKNYFFVSLPFQCRLLILVDSCAEWGWPDTLGTVQGVISPLIISFFLSLFINFFFKCSLNFRAHALQLEFNKVGYTDFVKFRLQSMSSKIVQA